MTQLTPIRGFVNTPVTKRLCIMLTILAVGISALQKKHFFRLTIDPFLSEYHQYWRLLLFQLSFINESDYLLAVILLFQFKVLERFHGSKKYLSLIAVFALYNAIVTFLAMSLGQLLVNFVVFLIKTTMKLGKYEFKDTVFNTIAPGPIGIISSLYIGFGHYIPVTYQFKILLSKSENDNKALVLTDHFQIHVIYTLLLLNNGFQSLIPGIIGLFIGKLYVSDLLPGSKSWLLPTTIFKLIISPLRTSRRLYTSTRNRFSGYQLVDSGPEQVNNTEIDNEFYNEHDDREELVEDGQPNVNEIRAETPVRPLAMQFFDALRPGARE